MKRAWPFLCLVVPAAALAPAAPALKDPPTKTPPIIGEWVRVGHTPAGTPVAPDREVHTQTFTADGEWKYSYGANPDGTRGKTFVTDTRQNPPTIDISMNGGVQTSWRGIYKIEGDTLMLCLVTGDQDRPRVFESSVDRPTTLWIFKAR